MPVGEAEFGVARHLFRTEVRPRDEFALRRSSGVVISSRRKAADSPLRVRAVLLGDVLFALDPRMTEWREPLTSLASTSGDVEIQLDVEQAGGWQRLAVIFATVEAPEELRRLRPALISELERLGSELATDLAGQLGATSGQSPLSLLTRLDRIEGFERDLISAAIGIRPVARSTQGQLIERRRWRPGEIPKRLRSARYAPAVLPSGEIVMRPDVLTVSRTRVSADVEEHRQFARGVTVLRKRAQALRTAASAALQEAQQVEAFQRVDKASIARERALSAPERRRLHGRIEQLRIARSRASLVTGRCQQLLDEEPWLQGVGEPRTQLQPTPTFHRVAAYARAYDALRRLFEYDAAADKAPAERFKTTSELYEVWVFVTCVRMLCDALAPSSRDAIEARLAEVRRGDATEFDCGELGQLVVIFEPVIEGLDARSTLSELPYRAALTSSALRPDIWVEWTAPGKPSRAAVIDAKCTARFRSRGRAREGSIGDELEQMRDYRSRVIDPLTGRQPVRAMFQVHYVAGEPILCNVRQLLQGTAPPDAFITGAVGAAPGDTGQLQVVVDRLLGWLMA
ncbi:hypothetical protein Poly30_47420 [Planctomycetes bacterium Poly30]|uniref:DUF2357 domain-containing protein n=1 Tax=Saltatorellus ferox TaxID=2528018 RepID=A0A518EYM0_9BACT|nr:hypothetical protein Poly30_47420 [Planctomycetes bacterium Poly30]